MQSLKWLTVVVLMLVATSSVPCWADPPATTGKSEKDENASPPAAEPAESATENTAAEEGATEADPQVQPPETAFVRLSRDEDENLVSMDTAIVRYIPSLPGREGLAVDLIGAIHIGDKSYYEALNEEFKQYEVLLYELVAPQGTRVPEGGGDDRSALSGLQGGMKEILELEFQLEQVDYQPENFVHADMSPEDFARSMAERDESVLTIFARMMGQSILQQSRQQGGGASDAELIAALFSRNRALKLKRIMAQQFEDLEQSMLAFNGPEGSTIITERNKVALKVMEEQIAAGKQRIGIFYGAGHLPDMEERLENEFGLRMIEQRWLPAWDLRDKARRARQPAEEAPADVEPAEASAE